MNLSVTFRHMEATEALKEYVRDKLDKIHKYFRDPMNAHVVLSTERGYYHVADINITLHNGIAIKGKEHTEDMYSSIDLASAKIERQVRKYKDRIRDHKPHTGPEVPIRALVFTAESMEQPAAKPTAADATPSPSAPPKPQIIKTSKFFAKPMTVEEAAMQMNLLHNDFLVFMNAASKQVNVVYRRDDGNYGLIETGAEPGSAS